MTELARDREDPWPLATLAGGGASPAVGELALQGRLIEEGRRGVVAWSSLQMSAKLGRASGSWAHARSMRELRSRGMDFGTSSLCSLMSL